VRLIKVIGDAAMLVGADTDALFSATTQLIATAGAATAFPVLRAGVARGPALRHAGDWYGNAVNVASRITGIAPPGATLATREAIDAAGSAFSAEAFGEVALKGIESPVALYTITAA
jgi:adenylate cyclase